MKKILLLALGFSFFLTMSASAKEEKTSQSQDKRPEIGMVAKVFKGSEGLYMTMLRIGKESDNTFLIKYWGIDNKWSGKIFKAKKEPAGRGFDYVIEYEGKPYHTLIERRSSWSNENVYEVHIPGLAANGVEVYYTEDAVKDVIPEHLLTEYLQQDQKNK